LPRIDASEIQTEDVDMADDSNNELENDQPDDASDVSEDDSAEMLKLRKANRDLTTQQRIASHVGADPSHLNVPLGGTGSAKLAKEIMPSGFTVRCPSLDSLIVAVIDVRC
jgi:hypothetical protein